MPAALGTARLPTCPCKPQQERWMLLRGSSPSDSAGRPHVFVIEDCRASLKQESCVDIGPILAGQSCRRGPKLPYLGAATVVAGTAES